MKTRAERIVASLRFKFGSDIRDLFNTRKYDIEYSDDNQMVVLFEKVKL